MERADDEMVMDCEDAAAETVAATTYSTATAAGTYSTATTITTDDCDSSCDGRQRAATYAGTYYTATTIAIDDCCNREQPCRDASSGSFASSGGRSSASDEEEPAERYVLRDVLPSNLSRCDDAAGGGTFVRSECVLYLKPSAVDNFVAAVSFLTPDREAKLDFLTRRCRALGPADERVRLLNVMRACSSVYDMRNCIEQMLMRTNRLLVRGLAMLSDDEDLAAGVTAAAEGNGIAQFVDVVRFAKTSLEQILASMGDPRFIATSMLADGYCAEIVAEADAKRGLQAKCERVWLPYRDALDVSRDEILSLLVQDTVVVAAYRAHQPGLAALRVALLIVLFSEGRLFAGEYEDVGLRVVPTDEEARRFAQDERFGELAREYMTSRFTYDSLVTTIVMFVWRTYFARCLEWPRKVGEMFGRTIDIEQWQRALTGALTLRQRTTAHLSFVRWLSVRKQRVYANFGALIGMFERMSLAIERIQAAKAKRDNDETPLLANVLRDASDYAPSVVMKTTDQATRYQYDEYEWFSTLCRDILVGRCVRTVAGVTLLDYVNDADLYENVAQNVADAIGLAMVSHLRHESREKRYVDFEALVREKAPLRYDATNESFTLLAVAIFTKIYTSKVTLQRIDRALQRQTAVWNERLGVCDSQQMTEVIACIVELIRADDSSSTAVRRAMNGDAGDGRTVV